MLPERPYNAMQNRYRENFWRQKNYSNEYETFLLLLLRNAMKHNSIQLSTIFDMGRSAPAIYFMPSHFSQNTLLLRRKILLSSWDYGTYHIRRSATAQASRRICAVSPEPPLFAHMEYGSRWRVPTKNQTSRTTGWLCMRVWRMSLRRTKSTIISWDGSNNFIKIKDSI